MENYKGFEINQEQMESMKRCFEKLVTVLQDAVAAIAETWNAALRKWGWELPFICDEAIAYRRAERAHSKWVHYATRSKKRRTRKKYHDKIMREYGTAGRERKEK